MKTIELSLVFIITVILLPLVYVVFQGSLSFEVSTFLLLSFNTLALALVATFLSFIFALPSAFIFTCKGGKLVGFSLFIISIVPPFLLATVLSNLFFTLHMTNGFIALSFAHMISVYPYTLALMILGLSLTPSSAKKSAKLYASNSFKGFFMFYFPFMKTTFSVAFILGVTISMSQYIITIMLGKASFPTLITHMIPFLKSADIKSASSYGIVFFINILIALSLFARLKNVLSKT